jgi:AGCS family alanine or glycine:cation symporter
LPAAAFDHYFGIAGSSLVTLSLLMFVISTLIVITWYGEKQAEFLFGLKFARVMRYVYLVSIIVGAIGVAKFLWQFLDILLAMIVIPNMIAILLLHKDVIALVQEFFTSKQFYLKDTGKVSADEVI